MIAFKIYKLNPGGDLYVRTDYTLHASVHPVNAANLKLKTERYEDEWFFRVNMTQALNFQNYRLGNSVYQDYDTVYDIWQDKINAYILTIEEDGTETYAGLIRVTKIDTALCNITVECTVLDWYSKILANKSKVYDLKAQIDPSTITLFAKSYLEWFWTVWTGASPPATITGEYKLWIVLEGWGYGGVTFDWQDHNVGAGVLNNHGAYYAREVVYLPTGTNPGGAWVSIEAGTYFTKWAREWDNDPDYAPVDVHPFRFSGCCTDEGMPTPCGHPGYTQLIIDHCIDDYNWNVWAIDTQTLYKYDTISYSTERAYTLYEFMQLVAYDINCDNAVSEIFQWGQVNPLTGLSDTNYACLMQLSDFKRPDATEPAKYFKLSVEWLLDQLVRSFNCAWDIYETPGGVRLLRIEHVSFYENGKTYTGSPVIGLDLTQPVYQDNIGSGCKIEVLQNDRPTRETFGHQNSYNRDFIGLPIVYDAPKQNLYTENSSEVIWDYTTDAKNVIDRSAEVGNDGAILLCCEYDAVNDVYTIDYYTGRITGEFLINARFSIANLEYVYYLHDRNYPVGTINGVTFTFTSIKPTMQVPAALAMCVDVNEDEQVRMDCGDFNVKSVERNLTTKDTQLELLGYE